MNINVKIGNEKKFNKIIHLADIHIRLYKRKEEYSKIFNRLFESLIENCDENTLIIIMGDIIHTKTELSPEMLRLVNDLLVKHFPNIVDYQFTASIENSLDDIARGEVAWSKIIADFYWPFHQHLEEKSQELSKKDIMPETPTNEVCDKCGAKMVIKIGRYGPFLACSAFPKC